MRQTMIKLIMLGILASCMISGCKSDNDAENVSTTIAGNKIILDPETQKVVDAIKSIGEVSLEDETLINDVKEQYVLLTNEQRNLVWNHILLNEAEEKIEQLKREALLEYQNSIFGKWKQKDSKDDYYMLAEIKENKIRVYWAYNEGNVLSLYWEGTYEPPEELSDIYTWSSRKDATESQYCFRAANNDIKEFTYSDGILSYEGSIGESSFTVMLEHENVDFDHYDETKICQENDYIQFCGMNIKPSKIYAEVTDNGIDRVYYYAPKALLMLTKNDNPDIGSNATSIEAFWEGVKENLQENGYELFLEEKIYVNGKVTRLLGYKNTLYGWKQVTTYMTTYYEDSTETIVAISVTCGQKTEYDYLSDFKQMLESVS